jgi:hypothetical protein
MAAVTLRGIEANDQIPIGPSTTIKVSVNQLYLDSQLGPVNINLYQERTVITQGVPRIVQAFITKIYTIQDPSVNENEYLLAIPDLALTYVDTGQGPPGAIDNKLFLMAESSRSGGPIARVPSAGFFTLMKTVPITFTVFDGKIFTMGESGTVTWEIDDQTLFTSILGISPPKATLDIGLLYTPQEGGFEKYWTSAAVLGTDINLLSGSHTFTLPSRLISRGDYKFRLSMLKENGTSVDSKQKTFVTINPPVRVEQPFVPPPGQPSAPNTVRPAPVITPAQETTNNLALLTNRTAEAERKLDLLLATFSKRSSGASAPVSEPSAPAPSTNQITQTAEASLAAINARTTEAERKLDLLLAAFSSRAPAPATVSAPTAQTSENTLAAINARTTAAEAKIDQLFAALPQSGGTRKRAHRIRNTRTMHK